MDSTSSYAKALTPIQAAQETVSKNNSETMQIKDLPMARETLPNSSTLSSLSSSSSVKLLSPTERVRTTRKISYWNLLILDPLLLAKSCLFLIWMRPLSLLNSKVTFHLNSKRPSTSIIWAPKFMSDSDLTSSTAWRSWLPTSKLLSSQPDNKSTPITSWTTSTKTAKCSLSVCTDKTASR